MVDIVHKTTDKVLLSIEGADLRGAYLEGAYLGSANLEGANLIDGGQDTRGYRFWAWCGKGGKAVYRAGCHEWIGIAEGLDHYSKTYSSDGDRFECLARLNLMHAMAIKKGWIDTPV